MTVMSGSNRTVTARTRLERDVADFLDDQAEQRGTSRSELLRQLALHLRDATESGLSCPHCKNPIELDL